MRPDFGNWDNQIKRSQPTIRSELSGQGRLNRSKDHIVLLLCRISERDQKKDEILREPQMNAAAAAYELLLPLRECNTTKPTKFPTHERKKRNHLPLSSSSKTEKYRVDLILLPPLTERF